MRKDGARSRRARGPRDESDEQVGPWSWKLSVRKANRRALNHLRTSRGANDLSSITADWAIHRGGQLGRASEISKSAELHGPKGHAVEWLKRSVLNPRSP